MTERRSARFTARSLPMWGKCEETDRPHIGAARTHGAEDRRLVLSTALYGGVSHAARPRAEERAGLGLRRLGTTPYWAAAGPTKTLGRNDEG